MSTDHTPLFTIVTAVLNRKELLGQMVESVLAQDFESYELIIVDNGSTDGTWEYCQSISNDRIRVYQCSKRGISPARNIGIINSNGKYIVVLDSDNKFISDHALQDIEKLVNQYPEADCLLTSNIDDKGNSISFAKFKDRYIGVTEYFESSGEFSGVLKKDWMLQNLYPEIDGAATEFPGYVYGEAATRKKMVISSLVPQVYGTESDDKLCVPEVSPKRAMELFYTFDMLIERFGKKIMYSAFPVFLQWSLKRSLYKRLTKDIPFPIPPYKSSKLLLSNLITAALLLVPYSTTKRFIERYKR